MPTELFANQSNVRGPLWQDLGASEVAVTASSELCAGERCYSAKFVLPATSSRHGLPWCEGASGSGVGEWLEFRFYKTNRDTMFGNARVKVMEMVTNDLCISLVELGLTRKRYAN